MKFIFTSILLLFITHSLSAQVYFNGTTSVSNLGCNDLGYKGVEYINNKPYSLVLRWEKIVEDTVPGSWFDMCANTECYVSVPDTGSNWSFPVLPNDTGFFNMHTWSGDSSGISTVKLWVYEKGFPSIGDTLTYKMNISCEGVGIKENQNVKKFNLYPSPANQYIDIECNDYSNIDSYTVMIIDVNGRSVVYEKMRSVSKNRMDVSNVSDGFYLLRIINNNDILHTQKILISKK